MSEKQNNLTICARCGSDACYTADMGGNYVIDMCYGCGFTTNTLMTEDSQFLQEQTEVLPELYKDLLYKDENGKYWMPSTVNVPSQGMIFIDGTSTEDWKWTAVKSISIPEEERENYPIPGKEGEYYEHKMDYSSKKSFEERDYMEALDYIGVFENVE